MTQLQIFDFDPSGNPINVEASDGTYELDSIQFTEYGVFGVRTGTDNVFIPWTSIVKVYQTLS